MKMLSFVVVLAMAQSATADGTDGAFCDLVSVNHGCCPACGYGWVDGACTRLAEKPREITTQSLDNAPKAVTEHLAKVIARQQTTSSYCESLKLATQRGCCSYCGHRWSTAVGRCVKNAEVPLLSFDGHKATTREWMTVNDPVMGGASTSSISVHGGRGQWIGEVKLVPGLGSPGFCTVRTVGDERRFPDCTGTESLELKLSRSASGLPTRDFSVEIGAKGVTSAQTNYRGDLRDQYCCGDHCRVPWSAFKLTFRGQPAKGPPLSEHLGGITHIGLSTAGTLGKFEVDMLSLVATSNATSAC